MSSIFLRMSLAFLSSLNAKMLLGKPLRKVSTTSKLANDEGMEGNFAQLING